MNLEDCTIETINGYDYVRMPNGRLIPSISGGRSNEPVEAQQSTAGNGTQPSLADLMKLVERQSQMLTQYAERMDQQESQFNELVDAIAQAVNEEGQGDEQESEVSNQRVQQDDEPEPRFRDDPRVNAQARQESRRESEEIAQLRRQIQKMEKQQLELQKVVEEREKMADEEREMRLASERDNLLGQALQEAGVLPAAVDAGLKLFRDNIAYDEDRDEFVFLEDKTGVKLPILEGVKDNLPDYLKATSIKHGGSGARGSQPNAMLENARASLARLQEAAKKSGQEADIAAYHSAKKQLKELETARGGTPQGQPARQPQQTRRPVLGRDGSGAGSAEVGAETQYAE